MVAGSPNQAPRQASAVNGGPVAGCEPARRVIIGKVDATPMTTHRMGLADAKQAFEMMRDKVDGIRPLVTY